jgi:DNA-binding response OmpR family regulator
LIRRDTGAVALLQKPFETSVLLRRLRDLLDGTNRSAA